MANKKGHRRFGNMRRLPSGRIQVRYPGSDGRMRTARRTFDSEKDAERYLTLIEAQMIRGEWTDPARGKVRLDDYAKAWIAQRPGLRPRTVDLYTWLLNKHIAPHLGGVAVGDLKTDMVRQWRAALLDHGVSVSVTAKAYRLLRAVLMTAVEEDQLIARNPCRIKGAGDEKPAERPVLTVAQVFELADRMRYRRFRALILLATFASLRWGEVIALRRCDMDLRRRTVRVRAVLVQRSSGELMMGPPKSRAGARVVSIPQAIVPMLREHLGTYTDPEPDALVFTGVMGGPLRRSNFQRAVKWTETVAELGFPGLHFHDLRHTGNTLAARSGASLRDLMARMGHDSTQAALIYQHASSEADRGIADALNSLLIEHTRAADDRDDDEEDEGDDGTGGVLTPVG